MASHMDNFRTFIFHSRIMDGLLARWNSKGADNNYVLATLEPNSMKTAANRTTEGEKHYSIGALLSASMSVVC
ncbi:hypothetical protein BIW11_05261 [Tropilaelaps mercedesae]|uniref:Uncharacterized protein n=1 Tax=Tropilaelaps mercedesae TaxID=418985 RepID=A0A1V9Y320_9ACAR|nr:hypothetical protein BIW11_05261 [Tropilaelaps mercedesae]